MKVGNRAYQLPIRANLVLNCYLMFKDIEENEIIAIYTPNCRKVEL